MTQSTITSRFQTTIPPEVRAALNLKPRQRVSYELRGDGSVILRPIPQLDDLFVSLKPDRPTPNLRTEKQAAREAIAREASAEGL